MVPHVSTPAFAQHRAAAQLLNRFFRPLFFAFLLCAYAPATGSNYRGGRCPRWPPLPGLFAYIVVDEPPRPVGMTLAGPSFWPASRSSPPPSERPKTMGIDARTVEVVRFFQSSPALPYCPGTYNVEFPGLPYSDAYLLACLLTSLLYLCPSPHLCVYRPAHHLHP